MDVLQGDLEHLMERDPVRAKSLFNQMAEGSRLEREMVADSIPGIAEHDYEFARDLLLAMDDRELNRTGSEPLDGNVLDAITSAARKMRDRITEEQAVDFRSRWEPHTH